MLIIADLHERHKAGEDALLRGLPFDIEPLADSNAAQHKRDGRFASGAVDREPQGSQSHGNREIRSDGARDDDEEGERG